MATHHKRYHVRAGYSPEDVEIDEEMDEVPKDIAWRFPYVQIALLRAIPHSALMKYLDEKEASEQGN